MAKYVIESPHTPEERLKALDETLAKCPEILEKFVWGCTQGEHAGWAYIEAEDKDDACAIIPEFLQEKAKVTEVNKLTPEQVKSFHNR